MKVQKCPTYKPNTEHVTYEELERIVLSYQQGDDIASDLLLGAFWKYLHKFVNVICLDRADITDKDIRNFVGLFMKKESSKNLFQYRRNAHARRDIYKTIANIQELFKHYSVEEIQHELIVSLLTLAQRYKSHGNYFHTYVQRTFHYEAYRQLKSLLDPSQLNYNLAYSDEVHEGDDGDYELPEESHHMVQEPFDEINENWINGLTVGSEFEELTQTQRRIMKMSYVDDMTDEEIADILGVCRATVNRRKQHAKNLITRLALESNLLKGV